MKGLDYLEHVIKLIRANPDINFEPVGIDGLPMGTVRTAKIGKTTIKFEVIAIDVDPPETGDAQ